MKTTSVVPVGEAPAAAAVCAVTGEMEAGVGSGAPAKSAKSGRSQRCSRVFCGQEHTVFIGRRWSFLSTKEAFKVIGHLQFKEEDTSYVVN